VRLPDCRRRILPEGPDKARLKDNTNSVLSQGHRTVVTSCAIMTTDKTTPQYALGYTDAEHARLIYQAARLAPLT